MPVQSVIQGSTLRNSNTLLEYQTKYQPFETDFFTINRIYRHEESTYRDSIERR